MGSLVNINPRRVTQRRNLENFEVLIEDTSPNSPDFFNISQLNEELSLGKNGFIIRGTKNLVGGTPILIEIKDVNDEVIFHEVNNYLEGVSRIVSVYVYKNTPSGPATINIMCEANQKKDGREIPEFWRRRYNIRWSRKVNVNANIYNVNNARFFRPPSLNAEIQKVPEIEVDYGNQVGVQPDTKTTVIDGNNVDDGLSSKIYRKSKGIQDLNFSIIFDNPNSPDFLFEDDMENGVLSIFDLGENELISEQSAQQYNLNLSQSFNFRIKDVISETRLFARKESQQYIDYPRDIILNDYDDFVISYTKERPVSVNDLGTELQLISLFLNNLRTTTGSVLRARVYARAFESGEPYNFVGDFELDPQELLLDVTGNRTNSFNNLAIRRDKRTGLFYSQADIDGTSEAGFGGYLESIPSGNSPILKQNDDTLIHSVLVEVENTNLPDVSCGSGFSVDDDTAPGFKMNMFEFNQGVQLRSNTDYTLSFKSLLKNDQVTSCSKFSVFIESEFYLVDEDGDILLDDGGSELTELRTEHIKTYEVTNSRFDYNQMEVEFRLKRGVVDGSDQKLVFRIGSGNWYFSDISLIPSQQEGFSPDYTVFYIPFQTSDLSNIGDSIQFRVDLFDLNNNRVPVQLETQEPLVVNP